MNIPQATTPVPHKSGVESHFIIGQDMAGQWLAVETHRLGGGVFRSRQCAIHFVELETGHRAGAYELSSAPVALRF